MLYGLGLILLCGLSLCVLDHSIGGSESEEGEVVVPRTKYLYRHEDWPRVASLTLGKILTV